MTHEPHQEQLIHSMVLALWRHPSEWLTFKRLSRLCAIANCDADIVGAFAGYRNDLFAISRDEKVKLQTHAVETIATTGIANWRVPEPPKRAERASAGAPAGRNAISTGAGCYCRSSHPEIIKAIRESAVPHDALLNTCCWRTLCRVRGLHPSKVDPETWRELCRRRAYIQLRQNPRGF